MPVSFAPIDWGQLVFDRDHIFEYQHYYQQQLVLGSDFEKNLQVVLDLNMTQLLLHLNDFVEAALSLIYTYQRLQAKSVSPYTKQFSFNLVADDLDLYRQHLEHLWTLSGPLPLDEHLHSDAILDLLHAPLLQLQFHLQPTYQLKANDLFDESVANLKQIVQSTRNLPDDTLNYPNVSLLYVWQVVYDLRRYQRLVMRRALRRWLHHPITVVNFDPIVAVVSHFHADLKREMLPWLPLDRQLQVKWLPVRHPKWYQSPNDDFFTIVDQKLPTRY